MPMPEGGAPRDAKVFSYDEARRLLPQVQHLTRQAVAELEALARSSGPSEAAKQERADAVVNAWARTVMAMGAEVKGLWLVDFDNGSGYYCWRHPEEGLDYFHSYEDGFQGRMRIQ